MSVPILIGALTLVALFPIRQVPDCPRGSGFGLDILLPCPPGVETTIGLTYSGHFISGIVIALLMAGALAISTWSFARIREQDRA